MNDWIDSLRLPMKEDAPSLVTWYIYNIPKNPWALRGRVRTLHSRGPGLNQTLFVGGPGFLGIDRRLDYRPTSIRRLATKSFAWAQQKNTEDAEETFDTGIPCQRCESGDGVPKSMLAAKSSASKSARKEPFAGSS